MSPVATRYRSVVCLYVVCHTRASLHPAKAVGRNEMPFDSDTRVVPSNIVLERVPQRRGKFGVGIPGWQRCRLSLNYFVPCFSTVIASDLLHKRRVSRYPALYQIWYNHVLYTWCTQRRIRDFVKGPKSIFPFCPFPLLPPFPFLPIPLFLRFLFWGSGSRDLGGILWCILAMNLSLSSFRFRVQFLSELRGHERLAPLNAPLGVYTFVQYSH